MQKNRPGILLVEDDPPLGKALEDNLAALGGFQVFRAETVREALHFATEYPTLRFIYLDIGNPDYEPFTKQETQDGRLTGLRLLPEFEELLPKAKIYAKTVAPSQEIFDYIQGRKSVISVETRVDWKDIERKAKAVYSEEGMRPETLIIHGYDARTLQNLQYFIRFDLKLGEPKILRNFNNY